MSKISEYKAIMQNPQKLEKGKKPKTNDELRIEFGVSATVDEINKKEGRATDSNFTALVVRNC